MEAGRVGVGARGEQVGSRGGGWRWSEAIKPKGHDIQANNQYRKHKMSNQGRTCDPKSRLFKDAGAMQRGTGRGCGVETHESKRVLVVWNMTFITRGGEGREDKNKDRKATRSEGRGLEESASRALVAL